MFKKFKKYTKVYKNKSEFRKDKNKHRIKNDSKYDFNQTIKYGYRISVVFKFKRFFKICTKY